MTQFDPSYGYTLSTLLDVESPQRSDEFSDFWRHCFDEAIQVAPLPELKHTGRTIGEFELFDLAFRSTNDVTIQGWVLVPSSKPINLVLVVGHGYGGCDEPNGIVPLSDCAYIYLCYRGISRSRLHGIPEDPNYHVLYNIDHRDKYIIRGCVEDTWLAVSAAEVLFPAAKENIGYMGISFSGGIGALALPWDARIKKAHLHVPTFGHQPLRLKLPSFGSARAVQKFHKHHPGVEETLQFYDAATAASYSAIPVHIAAALADPFVAPPGQFAIYNNLSSEKALFVLERGHSDYPNYQHEQDALLNELAVFFSPV
jgi:cephalosporin-C deacetylase